MKLNIINQNLWIQTIYRQKTHQRFWIVVQTINWQKTHQNSQIYKNNQM
jgi:hypothetical protein